MRFLTELSKHLALATEGKGAESVVSVAHERLFEAWPALKHWATEHQDDLRLVRQGELDVAEWHKHDYDLAYLWHIDRLKRLCALIERLPAHQVNKALREFAQPQQRLLQRLEDVALTHEQRDVIGDYLAAFGDPRPSVDIGPDHVPDIYLPNLRLDLLGFRVVHPPSSVL